MEEILEGEKDQKECTDFLEKLALVECFLSVSVPG